VKYSTKCRYFIYTRQSTNKRYKCY